MKTYDDLKALIEQRGVHPEFGDAGEGWGIEQNPHELATFLVRMQELGVQSVLEIGTGYKGGLSRFLAQDMGWEVWTIDVKRYGHMFEGVHYIVYEKWQDYVSFVPKDLVFIDGAHDYDSVRSDYLTYGKVATKAIAFHDIGGLRDCGGVKKFWFELARIPGEVGERDGSISYILKPKHEETMLGDMVGRAGIGWIEL